MSIMDDVNRVTLKYLKNDPGFRRWLDWYFGDQLAIPALSTLMNPFDDVLREWQQREHR